MQKITMTLAEVESWSAQFTGDRSDISYDGESLQVPDDLVDAVLAIDVTLPGVAYLAIIKTRLKRRIDERAEEVRLKYITPGAGQALTYQRKIEEAKRAVLEVDPSPETYTMLAASLGVDGETITDVAEVVLQMDAQWAVIGGSIERIRQIAKRDIDLADDQEAATAVVNATAWPDLS